MEIRCKTISYSTLKKKSENILELILCEEIQALEEDDHNIN